MIEKLQRDFLWEGWKEANSYHLVAWDEVYKPKEQEGLGIRRTKKVNKALLSKWLWHFRNEDDGFWRKVIIVEKYGAINKWKSRRVTSSHGVGLWKCIMSLANHFKEAINMKIGNGRNTFFWEDIWCCSRPLWKPQLLSILLLIRKLVWWIADTGRVTMLVGMFNLDIG